MQDIHYSDGRVVPSVICIWDHCHYGGKYRAFWCASPDATTGSPVIGYCSPGGEHDSVTACAEEVWRYHPGETIYRNGKEVLNKTKLRASLLHDLTTALTYIQNKARTLQEWKLSPEGHEVQMAELYDLEEKAREAVAKIHLAGG